MYEIKQQQHDKGIKKYKSINKREKKTLFLHLV